MTPLHRFINDLQNNPSFRQEVESLADQPEALAAWLARHGHTLTPEECRSALEGNALGEEALGSISGGGAGSGAAVEAVLKVSREQAKKRENEA